MLDVNIFTCSLEFNRKQWGDFWSVFKMALTFMLVIISAIQRRVKTGVIAQMNCLEKLKTDITNKEIE